MWFLGKLCPTSFSPFQLSWFQECIVCKMLWCQMRNKRRRPTPQTQDQNRVMLSKRASTLWPTSFNTLCGYAQVWHAVTTVWSGWKRVCFSAMFYLRRWLDDGNNMSKWHKTYTVFEVSKIYSYLLIKLFYSSNDALLFNLILKKVHNCYKNILF